MFNNLKCSINYEQAILMNNILIASYNSFPSIALAVESVLKRTNAECQITVFDSSPENSETRTYLQIMAILGHINLHTEDRQHLHGEALQWLVTHTESRYAVILDSDVEILCPEWLDVILSMLAATTLGVAELRKAGNFYPQRVFRVPIFHPSLFLINIDKYRDFGIHGDDWLTKRIPLSEFPYVNKYDHETSVAYHPIAKNTQHVHYDTGGRLAERILHENSKGYKVCTLPMQFMANAAQPPDPPFYAKHYEGMSARGGDVILQRRVVVKSRLLRLRASRENP